MSSAEYSKAWRARNKEHIRAYKRAAYARDPQPVKDRAKRWRDENRERVRLNRLGWKERTGYVEPTRHYTPEERREREKDYPSRTPEKRAEYARNGRARRLEERRLNRSVQYLFGTTVVPPELREVVRLRRAMNVGLRKGAIHGYQGSDEPAGVAGSPVGSDQEDRVG